MERNQRLFIFLSKKGLTHTEYAKRVGASRQQVSNWKAETHPVPDKYVLRTIEFFPDLDYRWFLSGIYVPVSDDVDGLKQKILELTNDLLESNKLIIIGKDEVIGLQKQLLVQG